MKTENVIVEKSFQFALRIVKLFSLLKEKKVERDIALQILRSGTSIGANIEEAMGGSSKKDFIHKLSIAQKEAFETRYWLRLLEDSDEIKKDWIWPRKGFGSIPVNATIGGTSWKTSIFPEKGGTYLLPIKKLVREEENLKAGDFVEIQIVVIS